MKNIDVSEFLSDTKIEKKKMLFLAQKESFIVRVLLKKLNDAGFDCPLVSITVNDINAKLDGVTLLTLYVEEGAIPPNDVTHFLTEKMHDHAMQMILIAEQNDMKTLCDRIPGDLIYRSFTRPVDNGKYAETVAEYFKKEASGDFKKSILIVDDDPQYLSLVREWLKGSYKVTMANSGLQAIKWLGKNKVDLILLDHEMPVTSGPQVLEMLRSDPETSSIPVMFLTGKGDKESVMKVVALRPEGYFLKNIKREELLEKLQEYFILHRK